MTEEEKTLDLTKISSDESNVEEKVEENAEESGEEESGEEESGEEESGEEDRVAAEAAKAEAAKAEEDRVAAEAAKAEEDRVAAEAVKAEEDRVAAEAAKAEASKAEGVKATITTEIFTYTRLMQLKHRNATMSEIERKHILDNLRDGEKGLINSCGTETEKDKRMRKFIRTTMIR